MMKMRRPGRSGGLFAAGLIVIGASGCDNVDWGGATLDLQAPTARAGSDDTAPSPDVPAAPALPPGDLLFLVTVDRGEALATPLAFVSPGEAARVPPYDNPRLGPLLADRLDQVGELTLFAEGTRAGTALVSGLGEGVGVCETQPHLAATLELRPELPQADAFLALRRSDQHREHGDVQPPAQVREVRAASLSMAGNIIGEVGAVWPPSVLGIRRDIRLFRGATGLGVAASFLYRDRLDTSPPPAGSYSIFVLGEERSDSVHLTYGDFHRSGTDGKAAPRFLAQMDWDGDGEDEVVLEVFREGRRGFRLLERDGDEFVEAFELTCDGTAG